jgi:nucleotide-binding universal stress UspA family protein
MIVKTAKKHNVDRIVIGTRGHTGIKQIMGSVTLKVLQLSPILVLVVPPEFRL